MWVGNNIKKKTDDNFSFNMAPFNKFRYYEKPSEKYIFSLNIDLKQDSEYKRCLSEFHNTIVENYKSKQIIFKIENNKDIELFSLEYRRLYNCFPYFYQFDGNFYCAYLEIYLSDEYYEDPFIFYIIDRARDIETKSKIIEAFNMYKNDLYPDAPCLKPWIIPVFKGAIKEDDVEMFVNNYFKSSERNDFYDCFNLFKHKKEFISIFTEYIKQLDDQKKDFKRMLFNICLCSEQSHCIDKKTTLKSSIGHWWHNRRCSGFNKIFFTSDEEKLKFENLRIHLLQGFFTYCLNNHKEIILKYKNEFINIMLKEIYYCIGGYFGKIETKIKYFSCLCSIKEFAILKEELNKNIKGEISDNYKNLLDSRIKKIDGIIKKIEEFAINYEKNIHA